MKFKLRSVSYFFIEWNAANIVKQLASVLVFGGFAVGAFLVARGATDFMLDSARLGSFMLHRFLSMLLFVFFLSINVGNIIVSYATFYRSPEMAYYLTKPISHTNLFLIKFLDNFFYSSTAFFLIAVSVLFGYGSHFNMTVGFYLQMLVFMLLPFMLIAGCVAVTVLLILMRFAHVIGIRKIVAILVLLYLALMYGYFAMTNPLKLVNEITSYYPRVDQYFGFLDPPFAKYLPNHWIAESLYWTMRGDSSYAMSYTMLLILCSVASFAIMMVVGKKFFYASWLSSLDLKMVGESRVPFLSMLSLTRRAMIEPQASVLLKKEFWQFMREPSQWIHFGVISTLVITFLVSVANINLKQSLPFLQTISYTIILLFNAFLIASVALRFVYPNISIEGMTFWTTLTAPVSRGKVFWLKFIVAFIPIVFLSEALVVFSHRSLREYPILLHVSGLIMFGVSFALVALNLGAGSYFTNFREKNPIRVASSQSATLTFLVSIVYLTLLVSIVFIPFSKYFGLILRDIQFEEQTLYLTGLLVLAISILIGIVSITVGLRALRRDF